VPAQAEAALAAQHHVIEHGHVLDQHEVLVHHADAETDRFVRVVDVLHLTVQQDLTAICAVIAVKDAHQGRLAGAILTHQAMDGPFGDGETDVRIRLHRSKVLGNIAEFYCWRHKDFRSYLLKNAPDGHSRRRVLFIGTTG